MSEKWKKPASPPPPMFLGEKERNYAKQVNDEIIERVVGQTVVYYPIDMKTTKFHNLYGESVNKSFLPPVIVNALIKWDGHESVTSNYGLDRQTKITVNFHRRRLLEDQDLYVREGDFIFYAGQYFEIVKLIEPKLLFGQQEHRFEITAQCINARQGLFPEEEDMFRLKQEDGPIKDGDGIPTGYGILVIDASDDSEQISLFLDLIENPCKYEGRTVYITALGPTPRPDPFVFPRKFYFNENCEWYESPFTINGLF